MVLCELSADSGLAELAAAAARGGFTPAPGCLINGDDDDVPSR